MIHRGEAFGILVPALKISSIFSPITIGFFSSQLDKDSSTVW